MTQGSRPLPVPWSLWAIAIVAVVAFPLLWLGASLPRWLLPGAVLAAFALRRPRLPSLGHGAVWCVVALGFAAIAFGALATVERSWDGYATWGLMARRLADTPTLDQPFFVAPEVYCYGRGYPLLQPILLAQAIEWLGEPAGRLLYPALWLLLVLATAAALEGGGVTASVRAVTVAGLALVPLFVEPGGGGAESGFADVFVALLLVQAGAAVVADAGGLAAAACLALPLVKAEGAVHAILVVVVAALVGRRRAAAGGALGATAGLLLWLPVQARVLNGASPGAIDAMRLLPAVVPLVVLAFASGLRAPRTRGVAAVLLVLGVVAFVVVGATSASPLGSVLGAVRRLDLRWASLPGIVGAGVAQLVWVRKLGLTFVVLGAAILAARRARSSLGAAGPLLALLLLAGVAIVGFLATRPPAALELFVSEGLVRYTAQWAGVAWLAAGLLLGRLQQADQAPPVGAGTPSS